MLDVNSNTPVWEGSVHDHGINGISVVGSDRVAVLGDNSLKIWDFAFLSRDNSGVPSLLRQLPVDHISKAHRIPCYAVSADGTRVATTVDQVSVVVADVDSGEELFRCVGHSRPVADIAFHPTDKSVATVAMDHSVRIWDDGGKLRHKVKTRTFRTHPHVRFTEDGSKLFAATERLEIIDTATGEPLDSSRSAFYYGFDVSSSGQHAVVREFANPTSVIDTRTLRRLYGFSTRYVHGFAMSRDGRKVAHPDGLNSNSIRIVDVSPDTRSQNTNGNFLAVNPTKDLLAIGGASGQVLLKNKGGQFLRKLTTGLEKLTELRFSSDGLVLAARGGKETVLLDVESGKRYTVDAPDARWLTVVPMDNDEAYVVTVHSPLAAWRHRSDKLISRLLQRAEKAGWRKLAVSDGSRLLAWAPNSQRIEVWDRSTGELVHELRFGGTYELTLSSDDQLLVASSYDSHCSVFDMATGKMLYSVDTMQGPFAFSPDSSRLAAFTIATNRRAAPLRLLNARTGDEIMTWKSFGNSALQFTSDGSQLAASRDYRPVLFGTSFDRLQEGTQHDLLAYAHPSHESRTGKWEVRDGTLKCESAKFARIGIPIQPLGDYRLEVRFTKQAGRNAFGLYLPVQHAHSMLMIDGWPNVGGVTGLEIIDGTIVRDHLNSVRGFQLSLGKDHTLVVDVNNDGLDASIRATLDGEELYTWNGNVESLGLGGNRPLAEPTLGFNAYEVEVEIHSARLNLLKGDAYVWLRPDSHAIQRGSEIDVLPHVNVDRDAEVGTWSREGNELITSSNDRCILLGPIEVDGSYEWSAEFTPLETTNSFGLIIATGTSRAEAVINGFGEQLGGLSLIDNKLARDNETAMKTAPLKSGQRYRLTARVLKLPGNRVTIEVELDGSPQFAWTGSESQLRFMNNESTPLRPGISSYQTKFRIHSMNFRLIGGAANLSSTVDSRSHRLHSPGQPSGMAVRNDVPP